MSNNDLPCKVETYGTGISIGSGVRELLLTKIAISNTIPQPRLTCHSDGNGLQVMDMYDDINTGE